MSEQITDFEATSNEAQAVQVSEDRIPNASAPETMDTINTTETVKPKHSKKKIAIIASAAIAIISIAIILLVPSKFERVKNECVHIAGMVTGSGDYFSIDTCPDTYDNMDDTLKALLLPRAQENALEAIKYANKELGFNGSVYSQMMKTTALMGRQSAENNKYKVSWTYHPDDGLEVTYEKK